MARRQQKEAEPRQAVEMRLRKWQRSGNVAADIDDAKLNLIGAQVVEEYEIDRESRREWENNVKDALKQLTQEFEEKTHPFEGAANIKSPLLTAASLQFAARAYPAIVNSPKCVKVEIVGKQDQQTQDRSERVSTYMSHQLLHVMDGWPSDTDLILHQIPAVGCAFRKVYWSREMQRPLARAISALNLIVNQSATSIHTVPRITEWCELYPHEIDERRRSGFFLDIDPHDPGISASDSPDGRSDSVEPRDALAPHVFLEQHRYLDMDDDGVMEPWIVFVHKDTQQVYRLAPNYDLNKAVFDGERLVRLPRFNYYVKYSFIPDPRGGFYDIGFGELLKSLSETLNSAFNQMLDAGHLQNAGGGFIGSGVNLKKTEFRFSPGKYHAVNVPGAALKDAIVNLQHPGPSPVMFDMLKFLLDWGQQITSVQNVLAGDTMPANQPATTTLAQIEQGLKVFTAIYKRVYSALSHEYRLLYDLNSRYPDDAAYLRVLGIPFPPDAGAAPPIETQAAPVPSDAASFVPPGAMPPASSAVGTGQAAPSAPPAAPPAAPPPPKMADDFSMDDSRIVPQADPQMVTDMQRLTKAQALTELSAHPVLGPQLNPAQVARRVVTNLGVDNMEELLQQPDRVAQAHAQQMQAMQSALLKAQVDKLQAEVQKLLAEAKAKQAGIIVQGHGMALSAEELRQKDSHAAHEAALAEKESQQAAEQAHHDRGMAVADHLVGRQDAAREHQVNLLGLMQPQAPDEAAASAQAGGVQMAPAVLNRVAGMDGGNALAI